MGAYSTKLEVRWSDLDPNSHVRHSVYYDWGAFCRMSFFTDAGLTLTVLTENHIGPILFREECVFRKEILFGDTLSINLELVNAKKDFSRWSIQHTLFRNEDVPAALITIDGAWIDTVRRKLTMPPEIGFDAFESMPRSQSFKWINK